MPFGAIQLRGHRDLSFCFNLFYSAQLESFALQVYEATIFV